MRRIRHGRRFGLRSARNLRVIRLSLALLAPLGWGLGRAPAWAAGAPMELDAAQLDAVTASKLRMDIELSANAQGAMVMTSTQGAVIIAPTRAMLVAIDPSAPAEARARLLGMIDIEVGIATGRAEASGDTDATCSIAPGISGADYSQVAQSQTFTALTATCSCTALAIGILH